jgi:hypothetical protein
MESRRLRAVFMRGGTSKAVMFRRDDLPAERKDWDPIFLEVMGSPDPYGRQLDGMGGGLSSLSKICVIGRPSRPDADVDYTFVQIGVKDSFVDYGASCEHSCPCGEPSRSIQSRRPLANRPGTVPNSARLLAPISNLRCSALTIPVYNGSPAFFQASKPPSRTKASQAPPTFCASRKALPAVRAPLLQ